MESSKAEKESTTGFTAGVILGTILGGVSLFLYGTRTGQKIKNQLSEEYGRGNLDLNHLHQKTNQKLEEFLKHSPFAKKLVTTIEEVSSRESSAKSVSANKDKKNFFSKKGKKLG